MRPSPGSAGYGSPGRGGLLPGGGWRAWLDPDMPRRLPHERAWNVAFRTLHLMAFGALLGGHVWAVSPERLVPALWLTVATGALLMGLELWKSVQWLFLGKGLAVLAKLGLLLCVPLFWEARVPLLLVVVALSSVAAHMPARYRNYSVLQRRVVTAEPDPGG